MSDDLATAILALQHAAKLHTHATLNCAQTRALAAELAHLNADPIGLVPPDIAAERQRTRRAFVDARYDRARL